MKKYTANDFSTNRKMLNKDLLRYVENYCSYLHHIKFYYEESFNRQDIAWLVFLRERIKSFLKDAPHSNLTATFEVRYQRCLTKLNSLYNAE